MSLLEVKDLCGHFRQRRRAVEAVKRVAFSSSKRRNAGAGGRIRLGQIGDGAVDLAIAALSDAQPSPAAASNSTGEELCGAPSARLRDIRGNRIAMVFQEPMTSLNPLHTIGKQIAEALHLHKRMSAAPARARVIELLRLSAARGGEAGSTPIRISFPAASASA